MMGKYELLGKFLKNQKLDRIPMTFAEIERILNAKLPASKKSRAFWSNNPENNVMTREWIAAGFETEDVDTQTEKLVLRRKTPRKKTKGKRHPIFGCMAGMVTVAEGYDLTTPTGDDWEVGYFGEERK
jgi:hypothetical protein